MTQSETYDLQTQRMAASQQNNGKILGRFDPIHIVLAIATVIFLILSIVFIILFATKHDTSTGFLSTGFSDNKSDVVSNELQSLLKNKFTVNSFALDIQDKAVSAVFSLRDSVSTGDVQKVISQSKLMTQPETTYGDKATAVCRQQPVFATTQPPATTVSTTPAPNPAKYCKGTPINRDIIVVVDMNTSKKINSTEKAQNLDAIRQKLINGLVFPQVNVFLQALVADKVMNISTNFISSADQLNTQFASLIKVAGTTDKASTNLDLVLSTAVTTLKTGRQYVPGAIFLLTDKALSGDVPKTQAREMGIFVGVAGVLYSKPYANYADQTVPYNSWTDLATNDPFQAFVCNFYQIPATKMNANFEYPLALDATTDTPACQVLDIIIAFDTSESLSRLILPKYVDFANKLVAQYKYSNDKYTRVGIITFNDDVTEKLTLTAGNNLAVIQSTINKVEYTGGLTNVVKALNYAGDQFKAESLGARSRVLIVLSDAVPTVGTFQDEITAGQNLKNMGVATFFVGYSSYSDDVKNQLGQVTNPNYIFGDTSDASFKGITQQILVTYPCPLPKCVTAYFAVEVSEATNDYVVQNLKDVLTVANKAATLQTGTESYQLVTYNEDNTQFNPQGDASLKSFTTFVKSLIDNADKRNVYRGGKTRLDTAINDISAEMNKQALLNNRFSGNILFFGQANDAVLDPAVDTQTKRNQLIASATGLKTHTAGLIYVVDDSKPAANFGVSLWSSVTDATRIILQTNQIIQDLSNTDYFTTWSKLSCQLPAFLDCFNTQLDVAVLFDLQKPDPSFMKYVTSLLNQFSFADDTHFSMLAYGSQDTSVLSKLTAHSSQDIQNYPVLFEEWRNGSWFITTTTTPEPTTSAAKPPNFWENNLYTVDANKISGVFGSLGTQFGCGHYSDDGDRLFAPNLFIFASDNFGSYNDAVWADFKNELHSRYGCWDCAGTPTFLFLSRNANGAPPEIGATINLSNADLDIDRTDDTSTQASINKFNNLVNSICAASLPSCSSYVCFTN